ncbi:MAG: beta-N-acetylglucosaminidase [Ignavibacteriales bacterium]|nr:MAG: beta-N-acetylglucosaminidase [Ignavibacteriales bacterium]
MKIIKHVPLLLIVSLFTFSICKSGILPSKSTLDNTDAVAVFNLNATEIKWVDSVLNKMTLFEKCAQMVFPWAEAKSQDTTSKDYERVIHLVKDLKVGGLLFLEGNISDQVWLTNKAQEAAQVPLLISSDFERGLGMRLKDGLEFPYNMAVAAADDSNLAYWMGKITSRQSNLIGVHQNYAPTVDLNDNPHNPIINIRAFSDNAALTSKLADAFIKGCNEEHILSTVKHFPGHGSSSTDSHQKLPLLTHSKEEFEIHDLVPFKKAIENDVKSVMVGHLEVPAYEYASGIPSSLSENIISGLLKNDLKFRGLIVTDALNMKGVTNEFSDADAAVYAVKAGNDCLLFPGDEENAINAIYDAVQNGDISKERIDYSVRKILAAKRWVNLNDNKFVQVEGLENRLTNNAYIRLAQDIADKSITLVKDDDCLLPVNDLEFSKVTCVVLNDLKKQPDYDIVKLFKEEYPLLEEFGFGRNSDEDEYEEAYKSAQKSDLILIPVITKVRSFSGEIDLPENHITFIEKVNKLNKPTIVMSLGNPYILSSIPEVKTYLCSYGDSKVSQNALFKAITGKIDITGKLPITLSNTSYKYGDGIRMVSNKLRVPDDEELSGYNFTKVDSLINTAIKDSACPGAVIAIGYKGKILYKKAYGRYTYDKSSPEMTTETLFDLASVSKVIGTTTAAMILYDEGKLVLDKLVKDYLPEFNNNGKDKVTIRNLLLHNSGLPAWVPFYKTLKTREDVINAIMTMKLDNPPGKEYVYSCLGMITLQQVMERITGKGLDEFLKEKAFAPLKMNSTMYCPPKSIWNKCAPTENDDYFRMKVVQGQVHDETAFMLGGVSGNAGLFSNVNDLSVFLQMILQKGKYGSKQIIEPSTIEMWTKKQTDQSTRGLGWDTKSAENSSAGTLFSMNSIGHTGFTGTSVWADKDRDLFVVLLTNRVYPTRANTKLYKFRSKIHDAVVKAIGYE